MPALSKLAPQVLRLNRQQLLAMQHVMRQYASTYNVPDFYKNAVAEGGTLQYERYVATDNRYEPQQGVAYNTWWRFFAMSASKYELWPLFFFLGCWAVGFGFVITHAFNKHEIQIDRSKDLPPWDWSREKDIYYKTPNQMYYAGDSFSTHQNRLRIMETLQNEMIQAAKKNGTR